MMIEKKADRHAWAASAFARLLCMFSVHAAAAGDAPITYEDHVAGILKRHCATCHGDGKQEGGLSLVDHAVVMKGAGGGEIVLFDVATVIWWDVKDGPPVVNKTNTHPGGVLECCFGPQSELATCGRDRLVKLRSNELKKFSADIADDTLADTKPPAGVALLPTWVTVSGDGAIVLTGDTTGRLTK